MSVTVSIEVIAPKGSLFFYDRWRSGVKSVLRGKTEPYLKALFGLTVNGWKKPPTFWAHHFSTVNEIGVKVYARNRIYSIVNAGSPRHDILARRGGLLKFQWGYRASTSPRKLNSRAAVRFGSFFKAPAVSHPGFAPREFPETIAETMAPDFIEDMVEAMSYGLP